MDKETKEQKEARLAANHDLSVAFMRHLRDAFGLKHCYITERSHNASGYVHDVEEVSLDSEPFDSFIGMGRSFTFTNMDGETWRRHFDVKRKEMPPHLKLEMYGNRAYREVLLYGVPGDGSRFCHMRFVVRNGYIWLPMADSFLTDFEKRAKEEMQRFKMSHGCNPDSFYETTKQSLLELDDGGFLHGIAGKLDELINGNVARPGEMMEAIRDAILAREG